MSKYPLFVWRPHKYMDNRAWPEIWHVLPSHDTLLHGPSGPTERPTIAKHEITADEAKLDLRELAAKYPPPKEYSPAYLFEGSKK